MPMHRLVRVFNGHLCDVRVAKSCVLLDLILYVPVNIFFSYVRMGVPGLIQY